MGKKMIFWMEINFLLFFTVGAWCVLIDASRDETVLMLRYVTAACGRRTHYGLVGPCNGRSVQWSVRQPATTTLSVLVNHDSCTNCMPTESTLQTVTIITSTAAAAHLRLQRLCTGVRDIFTNIIHAVCYSLAGRSIRASVLVLLNVFSDFVL